MSEHNKKLGIIGIAVAAAVVAVAGAIYWTLAPVDTSAYSEYAGNSGATPATTRPVFIPEKVAPPPSQTLKKLTTPSPALEAWATQWEAEKKHAATEESLAKLKTDVDASGLSAVDRLKIARALNDAKDTPTAAVWTKSALAEAKTEWAAHPPADGSDILERWDAIVKGCRPIWETRDLESLRLMLEVEKTLPRAGRQDQQPEWDRINYGQALLDGHNYPAVITNVQSILDDKMAALTTEQRIKLTMHAATSHFELQHYEEASKLLQTPNLMTSPSAREALQLKAKVDDALELATVTTPLAILEAHGNVSPELLDWAKQWKPAGGTNTPVADTKLAGLIAASNLSANDRLKIGRTIARTGDNAIAAVWFESGIDKARADLDSASAGVTDPVKKEEIASKILLPILPKIEMAGQVLASVAAFDAQKRWMELNKQVPRLNPWDQRPEWSWIAYMGSLWRGQRNDDALKEADEMIAQIDQPAGSHMTEEQKTELHFVRALALQGLHREIESVGDLKIITQRATFNNLPRAWNMLINALCNANRGTEAEVELQRYIAQGRVDNALMTRWKPRIEQAKASESSGPATSDSTPK